MSQQLSYGSIVSLYHTAESLNIYEAFDLCFGHRKPWRRERKKWKWQWAGSDLQSHGVLGLTVVISVINKIKIYLGLESARS